MVAFCISSRVVGPSCEKLVMYSSNNLTCNGCLICPAQQRTQAKWELQLWVTWKWHHESDSWHQTWQSYPLQVHVVTQTRNSAHYATIQRQCLCVSVCTFLSLDSLNMLTAVTAGKPPGAYFIVSPVGEVTHPHQPQPSAPILLLQRLCYNTVCLNIA